MARDDSNRNVIGNLVGAAGLAAPIIPLQSLDSTLTRNGLSRNFRVSDNAIRNLQRFTSLTPRGMADPAQFFPEYVERALTALNTPMWHGVPSATRVADALNDSELIRALKRVYRDNKAFRGFGPWKAILRNAAGSVASNAEAFENPKNLLSRALASHFLGVSGDYNTAYRRLIAEVAGEQAVNREFLKQRKSGLGMADDLYEAVVNHTKPTRAEFSGKSFASSSEYLDRLWKNTERLKGLAPVPGAYRNAASIAEQIISSAPDKDSALKTLSQMLGNKGRFYKDKVLPMVGGADEYSVMSLPDNWKKLFRSAKGVKGSVNVSSMADAAKLGVKDLASSIAHGDASRLFSYATNHHTRELKNMKLFNILQKVRNPAVRAALGAGSLGLAGLGIYNAKKNYDDRNSSLIDRIRRLFT